MSDSIPASGAMPDSAGLSTPTRAPPAIAAAAMPAVTTVLPTPVSVPETRIVVTVRTRR